MIALNISRHRRNCKFAKTERRRIVSISLTEQKKQDACPPPGRRPAQPIAFQRRDSIFDKEVLVIERTNMNVAVFIIADGSIDRCGRRNRDDLADGVRNSSVGGEAVIESVKTGEAVAEAAEVHAVAKAGSHSKARSHAVTKAAESVSEVIEAAEAKVKGVRVGVHRNQSGDCDEDEERGELFHCYSPN